MRIGLICPYSLSLPGGVQGQVLGLARTLRTSGHEVRVLGPCDGPPPDAGVTSLGNSLPTSANGSIAPIAPDPAAQLRTVRALRDEDFDILHLHEPLAPGPTMTSLLLRASPMVGTFHAAGTSKAYTWLNPVVRWLVARLDRRFAVSEEARAMAAAALGGSYEVVFNGVEVARLSKVEPWPTSGPTVLFVGRHEPRKGLSVLLDAIRLLPSDLRVWVASDGPQTDELRARYGGDPRIEWLGRLEDAEKEARMAAASVFCAPSLSGESFGVVLLEAMAAQTPVVASDLAGYRKVAAGGEAAFLVPPGDPAALAAAIENAIVDETTTSRHVAAGSRRAEEFSMRRLAEVYVDAYEGIIGPGQRRRSL